VSFHFVSREMRYGKFIGAYEKAVRVGADERRNWDGSQYRSSHRP